MILVSGKIRIPEADLDNFKSAGRAMVSASLQEAGCIDYAYSFDIFDPTLMRVTERWEDRDALLTHFQTPHMAAWTTVVAAIKHTDFELFIMEGDQLKFSLNEWHAKAS